MPLTRPHAEAEAASTIRLAGLALAGLALVCLAMPDVATAQPKNPFSVGIGEGGGSASGLSGWLLTQQATFERSLSVAVRAAKADGSASWMLAGLSLLYGILHAAGPGHGKAVVASYMFANERALRRGVALSFLAAALQGLVAILLVGVLNLVFRATAARMTDAARLVESLSYAGIAVLGLLLVWRKGTSFVVEWRGATPSRIGIGRTPVDERAGEACCPGFDLAAAGIATAPRDSFRCDAVGVHDPGCGHVHAPDPASLGEGFKWTSAALTVFAAGVRPCSGAILVLVFALAQGIFSAGVYATLAMSLGTAVTTSALAATAVFAGSLAVRLSGESSRRGRLVARGLELGAGLVILSLGLGLFLGITAAGASG